jgi:hypothetical protein
LQAASTGHQIPTLALSCPRQVGRLGEGLFADMHAQDAMIVVASGIR